MAGVEIRPYTPEMAPALTVLYNRAVRGVPHCSPVSVEKMRAALAGDYVIPPGLARHSDAVAVAVEDGEIVGFVHGAIGRPQRDSTEEEGMISFLWHQPGRRQAGVALLEHMELRLRDQGMYRVYAFSAKHRYPFYSLPSAFLSDRIGHVAALLGMCGYAKCQGEVYLDWRDFAVDAADPATEGLRLTVEHPPRGGKRPGLTLRAWQGEEPVGICESSCMGDYHPTRSAQDWIFTTWLGVEGPFQGRGVGRILLQQTLFVARGLGYRHAAISTSWTNYRAALFYSNFGYQVADWTYAWNRMLV